MERLRDQSFLLQKAKEIANFKDKSGKVELENIDYTKTEYKYITYDPGNKYLKVKFQKEFVNYSLNINPPKVTREIINYNSAVRFTACCSKIFTTGPTPSPSTETPTYIWYLPDGREIPGTSLTLQRQVILDLLNTGYTEIFVVAFKPDNTDRSSPVSVDISDLPDILVDRAPYPEDICLYQPPKDTVELCTVYVNRSSRLQPEIPSVTSISGFGDISGTFTYEYLPNEGQHAKIRIRYTLSDGTIKEQTYNAYWKPEFLTLLETHDCNNPLVPDPACKPSACSVVVKDNDPFKNPDLLNHYYLNKNNLYLGAFEDYCSSVHDWYNVISIEQYDEVTKQHIKTYTFPWFVTPPYTKVAVTMYHDPNDVQGLMFTHIPDERSWIDPSKNTGDTYLIQRIDGNQILMKKFPNYPLVWNRTFRTSMFGWPITITDTYVDDIHISHSNPSYGKYVSVLGNTFDERYILVSYAEFYNYKFGIVVLENRNGSLVPIGAFEFPSNDYNFWVCASFGSIPTIYNDKHVQLLTMVDRYDMHRQGYLVFDPVNMTLEIAKMKDYSYGGTYDMTAPVFINIAKHIGHLACENFLVFNNYANVICLFDIESNEIFITIDEGLEDLFPTQIYKDENGNYTLQGYVGAERGGPYQIYDFAVTFDSNKNKLNVYNSPYNYMLTTTRITYPNLAKKYTLNMVPFDPARHPVTVASSPTRIPISSVTITGNSCV